MQDQGEMYIRPSGSIQSHNELQLGTGTVHYSMENVITALLTFVLSFHSDKLFFLGMSIGYIIFIIIVY